MRRMSYLLVLVMLLSVGLLFAFGPNTLSLGFVMVMALMVIFGIILGIIPMLSYIRGLNNGLGNIRKIENRQGRSTWFSLQQIDRFFGEKALDQLFQEYLDKLRSQRDAGQLLSDIEDYINEDILAVRSWQNVVQQIPGVLTGLGILGTFVGLLMGIGNVTFNSVDAALSSVQSLLNGIQLAFYTSIAGVILSILFNIMFRFIWNITLRDLNVFLECFHKHVVPTVEEQQRYQERKASEQILELLERLPKAEAYSVARSTHGSSIPSGNERILMPQILAGMQNNEFYFDIQPRYNLTTRKVIGGEILIRWKHDTLGTVSPAVFLPLLEENGYITKLDQYVWESVCKTIRGWMDQGIRPVPISINVTKTDILALNVDEVLTNLVKKYRIPPRTLEIEITQNSYVHCGSSASIEEEKLRNHGFRVVLDGFNGDFIGLQVDENFHADALKLDLRTIENTTFLPAIFEQARTLQLTLCAEGIESMEQLSVLRKCGCTEGQGYYFSKPISVEEFLKITKGDNG